MEDIESIWANDVVVVGERNPDELQQHTDRTGPDPQATPALRLTELRCDDKRVSGRFVQREAFSPLSWSLELLRSHEIVSVKPDSDCCFTLMLPSDLKGTEAGRVIVTTSDRGRLCSPYLWIDQPAELQRYGNRSFHTRVKDVIRTFDGAGKLFEELMNFLWERVDPIAIQGKGDEERETHRRFRGRQPQDVDTPPDETIPPPESFITEEALVESIGFHIGAYLPYDRSNLSLRDLLSLALLRLTADTAPSEIVDRPFDERNEDADADKLAQRETEPSRDTLAASGLFASILQAVRPASSRPGICQEDWRRSSLREFVHSRAYTSRIQGQSWGRVFSAQSPNLRVEYLRWAVLVSTYSTSRCLRLDDPDRHGRTGKQAARSVEAG